MSDEFPEAVNDYPPERHAHDAVESLREVQKSSQELGLTHYEFELLLIMIKLLKEKSGDQS